LMSEPLHFSHVPMSRTRSPMSNCLPKLSAAESDRKAAISG
jgi:hypothetical protein